MVNSKIKTIWTTNGRAPDSRDVWDFTGNGLRISRIDIPASAMVIVDGYDKVEYRLTMGDGSVVAKSTFDEVISYMDGSVESKTGSGFMTVFFNESDMAQLGVARIDVYKEWEAVDPEPEPIEVDELKGISARGLKVIKSGNAFGLGGVASRKSWDDAAESNETAFISATNVNPESGGQYIMGISVAHASGYTFQFGGRDGKLWVRFREKGVIGEWSELQAGGSGGKISINDISDIGEFGKEMVKQTDANSFRSVIGVNKIEDIIAGTSTQSVFISAKTLKDGLSQAPWFKALVKKLASEA
ncbi:hypothetical protein pEaSNUABM57_00013 [Erwinia phage pEa_SNUABM_57]|uniref:Uncharacterized protein n=1 Tax=Erwinia phage pEa_SNUABM_57 TaxID=2996118 RepID=A0A9E8YVQ9_9CAUD|nr:hypothetical protein pEaSNUABM57_00013 [Erwinia phage pEa_SNUABM_57]